MCGIFCSITCGSVSAPGTLEKFEEFLCRRGPDGESHFIKQVQLEGSSREVSLHFSGYTLQLQGPLTLQPIIHPCGDMLLWNGEIFGGDIKVDKHENDGLVLLQRLATCSSDNDVISEMSKVKGPWSFVYWKESSHSLFFGRDFFGRRSLLWQTKAGDGATFSLSSVARRHLLPEESWQEVPARGIYRLDLQSFSTMSCGVTVQVFPWQQKVLSSVTATGQSISAQDITILEDVQDVCIPSLVEPLNKLIPKQSQSSEQGEVSADRLRNHGVSEVELQKAAEQLVHVLAEAVRRRVQNVPFRREREKKSSLVTVTSQEDGVSTEDTGNDQSSPASVAILFSGGIDSMVLAALADRFLPADQPIDLLNVAFKQKMKPNASDVSSRDPFEVPDRITGRSGLQELRDLNPQRLWHFVEINITTEELQEARDCRIGDLVFPLVSVLDDSIGCAMWFAARGEGVLHPSGSGEEARHYTSKSKVVLSGLGADEQLAGYSRHRTHFIKGGYKELLSQLGMELARIPSRNMGRDDRVISDHGREARFPFLDEDVVSYLNGLRIQLKANLSLPRGEGEKQLLRVAARQIGLTESSRLPKRAIQFGSKIAKLETSTQKASDVCSRLLGSERTNLSM